MAIKTDNYIFVFGSNLAGRHGAGAARYAANFRGAMMGVAEGRTGQSYAIPTKDARIERTLPLDVIQDAVERFMEYAREHPNLEFQVTCIGCGLAGLKDSDIAPMFDRAPSNCWFDTKWQDYLDVRTSKNYWGTF